MYAKSTRPSAKRDDHIAHPRRAQTGELRVKRAMRMFPRSGQIFMNKTIQVNNKFIEIKKIVLTVYK